MDETKDLRVALIAGNSPQWSEAATTLLLAHTDCLVVVEALDQLFSLQSKPEMIFVCLEAGNRDQVADAAQLRSIFGFAPLVLIAAENIDTLKTALAVGALAVLEPPFSESSFATVFQRCRQLAQALRREALKQQETRKRSELFMRSPSCHVLVDAKGQVASVNEAGARILGLDDDSSREFGRIARLFFTPRDSSYPSELESAVHSGKPWRGTLSGRAPGGAPRSYRVCCQPLAEPDGTSGTLLTLHDVSEAYSAQARLRIDLQASRDCLALAGASEFEAELQQLLIPGTPAPLQQGTFSLAALLDSLRGPGETGAAPATVTLPDYLPRLLRGDASRLGYALKAVLRGSAGFGAGAPRVSLALKERTPAGLTVQFNIQVETGSAGYHCYQGVADYLACADQSPNAASGLGLAAVLIEQMGGMMLIRTERGRGRTVCCSVPLILEADSCLPDAPAPAGAGAAARVSGASGDGCGELRQLKILVAEDCPTEQAALKSLLEGIGCQAVLVGNGREALDEFETGEYSAILMDILMPELDGFEATRLIRERERITGGRIPVLALSSYSLKAIQEKCASVGMNGSLAKPVAKDKLVQALRRIAPVADSSACEPGMPAFLQELAVVDARQVLENLDYDLETYRELVAMYLTGFAGQGNQLAEMLADHDLKKILSCAHGLKGMASNIGALRLAEVARQIQELCGEGEKPDSEVWAPILKMQSAAIKDRLELLDWSALERLVAENC